MIIDMKRREITEDTKKIFNVNIRINRLQKNFIEENEYSPTKIFNLGLKQAGFKNGDI